MAEFGVTYFSGLTNLSTWHMNVVLGDQSSHREIARRGASERG